MSRSSRAGPGGNIVLIGFMASGKSEVGRRLAEWTGRGFVDTDQIVESSGLSIQDIFASEGEAGFRRRESEAVKRASHAPHAVISTGGGAVLSRDNVKELKRSGVLVYLQTGEEELWERLRATTGRPLIDSAEPGPPADAQRRRRLQALLADRLPIYESAADVTIATDQRDVDDVAREVLKRLDPDSGSRRRPRSVEVSVSPPYRVVVGRRLLRRAGTVASLPRACEKICIVSHPRVMRLWGDELQAGLTRGRLKPARLAFPEGEERKTLDTAARLYRRLAGMQFHRSDVIVALGGGVVGDVAGFVASTYARGVPVVQVPTTLLGMVDSAIGGKTGVNLAEGKNLVGTFHQPLAVIADVDTLRTLPEREFRGGLAEVVKYALIADPPLGEEVIKNAAAIFAREDALVPIILRSVAIKAAVVASDEREAGRRAVLNYGHTLGHALEAAALAGRVGSGRGLHHGEAIAIGMHFAAWISVVLGLAGKDLVDEHLRVLQSVGLPTTIPRIALDEVLRYMGVDKKYAGGMRFVLLTEPGTPVVQGDVPRAALEAALDQVTEG